MGHVSCTAGEGNRAESAVRHQNSLQCAQRARDLALYEERAHAHEALHDFVDPGLPRVPPGRGRACRRLARHEQAGYLQFRTTNELMYHGYITFDH